MFERFTDCARITMARANQEAQRLNHDFIGTEHILLGLVREDRSVGGRALKSLNVSLHTARLEVAKLAKPGSAPTTGRLPQTPRAKRVMEYAIEAARTLNHAHVGTEHMLLGLLHQPDSTAARALMNHGLQPDAVRNVVLNLIASGATDDTPVQGMDDRARSARRGR